jgi:DNA-binding NarL/FixJ family response regulator
MINVLVVHEFPLMCNVISSVLDDEPDIQVIGFATSVDEAMTRVKKDDVDIVLISTRLPDRGSYKLTNALVKDPTNTKVLILGITETREQVLDYIEAGATGYVLKESSLDDLLAAIRAAHNDKALISPEIAAVLMQRVNELSTVIARVGISPPESYSLTTREMEVLDLLYKNKSNQEIAKQLVIELGTVKNHVHSILNKLGVSNREEAAMLSAYLKRQTQPNLD